jgi:hypothetical protein
MKEDGFKIPLNNANIRDTTSKDIMERRQEQLMKFSTMS